MDLPRELGQRVAVLGGTFDPVHDGHLALAEAAFTGLGLDSLILVPAAVPPHKRDLSITPLGHRLAMLRLAMAGRKGLYVSSLEAERPGPSFSVDTLAALRAHFGAGVSLFFLLGIDAFADMRSWKQYQQLPLLADLVVVERAGADSLRLDESVRSLFGDYCREAGRDGWLGPDGRGRIRPLRMTPAPISSTMIRELAASGQAIDHLLPNVVSEYIRAHHLYCRRGNS